MRDTFYNEIRKRIKEIRKIEQNISDEQMSSPAATENYANKEMLLDTVERLGRLSLIARRDGLLALEAAALDMDGFPGAKYLQLMTMLVCDGTDPEDLEEALYLRYFSASFSDYAALQYLVMMYGIMAMQAGKNPRVTEEAMLYILPEELSDKYEQRREEQYKSDDTPIIIEDFDMRRLDELCSDDIESGVDIGDEYYYVVKMLEEALSQLDDRAVQRLLRDVDNSDLVYAMKIMSGKTRKILFSNLSRRLAILVAEDYDYIGPVRLPDACNACQKIFMVLLRLIENEEIVYSEQFMLREMAKIFLSKKDIETKVAIKESENKLYGLWKEYLHHSNRIVGKRNKRN